MSAYKLAQALRGTIAELESVLCALNDERMPHDGDEFHERLEAAKKALATFEAAPQQEPVATVRVNKTGGNAGLAWTAVPCADAPLMRHGDLLYAAPQEPDKLDAERYRLLRRGQHWSVIDGLGGTLRAEELDAAIDARKAQP